MARRKPGEQARRDARAKSLGYKSEYDYRAHGYGKRAPSEPRFTGKQLRKLRGHAGASDLAKHIRTGDVVTLHVFQKEKKPKRFEVVSVTDDGDERTWYIQGDLQLSRVQKAISDIGGPDAILIVGSPAAEKAFLE